jgi:hypothetical protein
LKKYAPDVAFLVSLGCLSYGCGLAWYPAGWIVPSTFVLGIVVVHHFRSLAVKETLND